MDILGLFVKNVVLTKLLRMVKYAQNSVTRRTKVVSKSAETFQFFVSKMMDFISSVDARS